MMELNVPGWSDPSAIAAKRRIKKEGEIIVAEGRGGTPGNSEGPAIPDFRRQLSERYTGEN
jgi:hypothetical protein